MCRGAVRLQARAVVALCLTVACSRSKGGAPLAATPAQAPAENAIVTASRGTVELLRGPGGSWSQVHVGDRLGAADALRTDLGEADVAIGGVRVRLHEASRLEIQKISARHLAAKVKGSVESDVDEKSASRVEVNFEGSDAVARSDGGHFFLTGDGKGVVVVGAVTGAVHLSSGGKDVELHDGEVSHVIGATQPSAPTAALRRVLLSVEWPRAKATSKATLPLAGAVEPGSRVFVQGEPVTVETNGSFRTDVPLKKGKQKVSVLTIDALGRRKQVETVVLRDDSLPEVKVKKKLWQWR